jgi:hypothetical protein
VRLPDPNRLSRIALVLVVVAALVQMLVVVLR